MNGKKFGLALSMGDDLTHLPTCPPAHLLIYAREWGKGERKSSDLASLRLAGSAVALLLVDL